jgi:hypothetical protein
MEALGLGCDMAQAERATRPKRWRHAFSMRERWRKNYADYAMQLLVDRARGFAIASIRAR